MGSVKWIGQKFGRLTIVDGPIKTKNGICYQCVCECGATCMVRKSALKSGNTKSCGCLSRELASLHWKTHGLSYTRLHSIWGNMIQRCENVHHDSYRNYGAKGITVCTEWRNDFKAFYDWAMSNGYEDTLTIDRINSHEGYNPSNCRFVSRGDNTRMMLEEKRQRPLKSFQEVADICGLTKGNAYYRLQKLGIQLEDFAVTTIGRNHYFDEKGISDLAALISDESWCSHGFRKNRAT